MKIYNPLITILLALNIASCGDKDRENFFSFDDNALKSMYQSTDKIDFTLLNNRKKPIDSVAYFVNDKRVSSVKGNGKFTLDLNCKKLGYQNISLSLF